ncbi:MAG TPA: alpha-galactosidase [Terracidiphilus sp.]|nr:alpha-galactosidase [Terracidiphilus sp.]
MKERARAGLNRRQLIQSGALAASGLVLRRDVFGAVAGADESSGQAWTIGNDRMARTIAFKPAAGLVTTSFKALSIEVEYVLPQEARKGAGREFAFVCNGHTCAGNNGAFDFVSAHEDALAHGRSLTVVLRHKELALEVSVVYRVYDGHAALRKNLVLHNTGSAPLHISHLAVEAVDVSCGHANELTLLTQYGAVPRETFYTGRSEDAGLLLANGRTGVGMAVLSEVPGYMKRTEIGGFRPETTPIAVMYDTDLMPFERTLAAGEQFATASASLIAFKHEDGFNDPRWAVPSYTSDVLVRRVNAQGPPWIYNTWEPFTRSINHDIAMELIEAAGAMGMDIFTIDDGWQQEYGENAVNLTAFPGGLEPILSAVESRGMRLGLWIPMAAIGTDTAVYREHPEWAALDQDGKPKFTGTAAGTKAVMCMATAYRETAAARIIDAIEKFRLAYVKLDLTTIFNAYGEAPGCWAHGHDHGDWAESLNRIYEGISYVTGRVYEKHPDVLLDLTFELWGQKHIIDAGLLAAGDLDWMSNVDDREPDSAGPLQARQLLYQRAPSMPVEAMLIGNLNGDQQPIAERFATCVGSAPVMLGDLRRLSAADRAWYRKRITWFRKFRQSKKISESFFPLGSWQQTTPAAWDGFARMTHTGDGVIALFRNESNAAEAVVLLPLMPEGRFTLRSVISGSTLWTVTKADWARGVAVQFAPDQRVEVIEVTAVKA